MHLCFLLGTTGECESALYSGGHVSCYQHNWCLTKITSQERGASFRTSLGGVTCLYTQAHAMTSVIMTLLTMASVDHEQICCSK